MRALSQEPNHQQSLRASSRLFRSRFKLPRAVSRGRLATAIPVLVGFVAAAVLFTSPANGDTVRLVNGDTLKGYVENMDDNQLVIRSESFGEMKIPRHRVQTIMLGDKPLPTAAVDNPAAAGRAQQNIPAMQNPQVQQQLDRIMRQALGGGAGMSDLQQNIQETRRGLQDLKKDMNNDSASQALDSYIKMFELFGNVVPPGEQSQVPANQRPAGNQPATPNAQDQ